VVFITGLDAVICSAELDAVICGADPFFCHASRHADAALGTARDLDTVIHGVEPCNLDAMKHGVDPRGPKLRLSFTGVQKRIFLKKKAKF
jgi:hypothetical protein